MRDFINVSKVIVIMSLLAFGVSSCGEDSNNSAHTPGKITSEVSEIDLYAMEGRFEFSVEGENKNVAIDASKFVYSDINISYDGEKANAMPAVKRTFVDLDGKTVIVFEYDFSGCSYAEGSFVLGYAQTQTAIKLNFRCQDIFRMQSTPILPKVEGLIFAEKQTGDFTLPEGLWESLSVGGGFFELSEHLEELDFRTTVESGIIASLNEKFSFTDSEVNNGYAEMKFGHVINPANSGGIPLYRQYVSDFIRIYPSAFAEDCVIPEEEVLHRWDIRDLAESLGIEKKADGNPAVAANTIKGYIAKADGFGVLEDLRKFNKSLFMSTGVGFIAEPNPETGEIVQKECPIITLRGLGSLEPGRYNFVVRAKKVIDKDDDKYVDIVFPFIKE